MENLVKAVINVMEEVKGMEKNSKVGSGTYAYNGTKDQDVKEVFNESLAKNGLCVLPIEVEDEVKIDRWEENGKSKQSIFTKVKTKYLLLHTSGESQVIAGYGHGIDNQDKGAGKATTYALKNALLYTFLTPVGKIDDTDNTHSNDIQPPKNNQTNFSIREIKPSELGSNWNGKVYAGNTIYLLKEKIQLSKEQHEKILKHPKYKPNEVDHPTENHLKNG